MPSQTSGLNVNHRQRRLGTIVSVMSIAEKPGMTQRKSIGMMQSDSFRGQSGPRSAVFQCLKGHQSQKSMSL
mgnify:CR=1 FL=1